MATIRCMDVADSAQFVVDRGAELRNRGWWCFVASLLESLRNARPRHPFGKSSGEGALNSECSSYYKTINALWLLHPGMTRSFFLCVPLKKEWSATYEGERRRCGCSVDACGGSIVDWRTAARALFLRMDQPRRVAPPKSLWQMPVALQSEAAPRFGQWGQTGRTWKWSIDVDWWRNDSESTRFVL